MNSNLTAVMYYYVRPIVDSKYPTLNGLELSAFKGQLDYLQKYYRFIFLTELVKTCEEQLPLEQNFQICSARIEQEKPNII